MHDYNDKNICIYCGSTNLMIEKYQWPCSSNRIPLNRVINDCSIEVIRDEIVNKDINTKNDSIELIVNFSVNGFNWGTNINTVIDIISFDIRLITQNRIGLKEIDDGAVVYRFENDELCETTIAVHQIPIMINNEKVHNIYDWICAHDKNIIVISGFTISQSLSLAVDLEDDKYIWLTSFKPGKWDKLITKTTAQQGDAPEPATSAIPASQQSFPPAR